MKPLRLLCALALVVLVAPAACGQSVIGSSAPVAYSQALWQWGNTPYTLLWRVNPAAVVAAGSDAFVAPRVYAMDWNFTPPSNLGYIQGGGDVGVRMPLTNGGRLGIGGIVHSSFGRQTVRENYFEANLFNAAIRVPLGYRFGGEDKYFAVGIEPGFALLNHWGRFDTSAQQNMPITFRTSQMRALSLGVGVVLQRERWNVHFSIPAIFLSNLGSGTGPNRLIDDEGLSTFQFGGQYRFQTGNFELSPTVFTVWIPGNGGYILSSWPSFIARTDVVLQARIREKWLAVLGFAQYGAGLGPSAALGAEWGRWRALASVRWLIGLWHSGHVAYQSAHIEAVVSMRLVRQGE